MDELLDELDVPFRFTTRPSPVPGDFRPAWRMALILLILQYSRGKKASLQKLHVLNWAAKSDSGRESMLQYLGGTRRKDELVPRIDPSLNRAMDFAVGEHLVSIEGGKSLRLTERGTTLATEIIGDGDCMTEEIEFFAQVARQATEQKIDDLLTWKQIA